MGDAARDVIWVQLVVDGEGRGETFQLGQHVALEASAPELCRARLPSYGVRLFASPNSVPRSRQWSCPCTRAQVRLPIPQTLHDAAPADSTHSAHLPLLSRALSATR